MSDLARHLRRTTEHMASFCSVDMALWNEHANACLDSANAVERITAERDALRALVLALEVFVERVESGHWQTPMQMKDECIEFRARIDALLNKGGRDE